MAKQDFYCMGIIMNNSESVSEDISGKAGFLLSSRFLVVWTVVFKFSGKNCGHELKH